MPRLSTRGQHNGGGGGYNPPIPQTDVQNLTSDLLKSQGVISVTASGSVTAGSLGRLINDGGVLKAKQVSKTLLRSMIGIAGSTTNAFSEVSACSINGILVLFYRGTSAYPTVLAINPLTGAKGTPVTFASVVATGLGISTNGVNCLCTYTKSSVGQAVAITVNTETLTITAGAETALTGIVGTFFDSNVWVSGQSRYVVYGKNSSSYHTFQTLTVAGTTITLNNQVSSTIAADTGGTPTIAYNVNEDKIYYTYGSSTTNYSFRTVTIVAGSPDTITISSNFGVCENPKVSGAPMPSPCLIYAYNKILLIINSQNNFATAEGKLVMYSLSDNGGTLTSTYEAEIDKYGVAITSYRIEAAYDPELDILNILFISAGTLSWKLVPMRYINNAWTKEKCLYIQYQSVYAATRVGTICYDSVNGRTIGALQLNGTSGYIQGYLFTSIYDERLMGNCIFNESKANGETVNVTLRGYISPASGLVPGLMYYWQNDGTIGLTPTISLAGKAISSTQLDSLESDNELWI